MKHTEKQRKKKASELPEEVWHERLILKLFTRQFIEITPVQSAMRMKRDAGDESMPHEYKDRPRHQGFQRRFRRRIKGRTIEALTSFSKLKGKKKEAYFGWVILSGTSIKTKRQKLFSSPIYDYESFFETMLGWVDAFVDLAKHWPTTRIGAEYTLEHIPGTLKMTQFVHTQRNGSTTKKTTFLLTECKTLSKETLRFLKKKLRKRKKSIRMPRIVKSSQRRDEAIASMKKK